MLPVLADGTNRTTTSDIKLGPHLIPKGTMVWVPLMGLFNSPHNWVDPGQYSLVCAHPLLMPLQHSNMNGEAHDITLWTAEPELVHCI